MGAGRSDRDHMLIGNILEPKIMSKGVDLSPVVTWFSLIFWSFVGGSLECSSPIMVIIKIVLEQIETLRPLGNFVGGASRRAVARERATARTFTDSDASRTADGILNRRHPSLETSLRRPERSNPFL